MERSGTFQPKGGKAIEGTLTVTLDTVEFVDHKGKHHDRTALCVGTVAVWGPDHGQPGPELFELRDAAGKHGVVVTFARRSFDGLRTKAK